MIFLMNRKKVVVVGGGTGTYQVLTGLKKYPLDLSAVITGGFVDDTTFLRHNPDKLAKVILSLP